MNDRVKLLTFTYQLDRGNINGLVGIIDMQYVLNVVIDCKKTRLLWFNNGLKVIRQN